MINVHQFSFFFEKIFISKLISHTHPKIMIPQYYWQFKGTGRDPFDLSFFFVRMKLNSTMMWIHNNNKIEVSSDFQLE